MVVGLTPEVRRNLLLTVGSHRADRPLTPIEVANALQTSLDAGGNLEQLATGLQLEGTTVLNDFLRLRRLAPEVQHLVDWGKATGTTIGFKAASKLAQLPDAADQVRISTAALQNRFSKAEIEQVVQLRRRSKRPVEECIGEVVGMRPQVQLLTVFVGAVAAPHVREWLATLSQSERDRHLQEVITRSFVGIGKFGSRLGTDRFTITGGANVSAALSQAGTDFEATINRHLGEVASP